MVSPSPVLDRSARNRRLVSEKRFGEIVGGLKGFVAKDEDFEKDVFRGGGAGGASGGPG